MMFAILTSSSDQDRFPPVGAIFRPRAPIETWWSASDKGASGWLTRFCMPAVALLFPLWLVKWWGGVQCETEVGMFAIFYWIGKTATKAKVWSMKGRNITIKYNKNIVQQCLPRKEKQPSQWEVKESEWDCGMGQLLVEQ